MSQPAKNDELDFKKLHMPDMWSSQFAVILERITKVASEVEAKKDKNYLEQTAKLLRELVRKIDEAYTPRPPRTLKDAHDYALTRKFKGTYLALMNDEEKLVKVLILKKGEVLDSIPKWEFVDKEIEIKMNAHLISIPELEVERSIPKSVVKAIPFASDKKSIRSYE